MKPKLLRRNLTIKKSSIQGYGVFSDEEIKQNEIIEECCILKNKSYLPEHLNYYFEYVDKEYFALALGFGSIYNHSNDPNAEYDFDPLNELLVFRATRLIKEGEEIFVYYGDDWFKKNGVKRIESYRYRIRSYASLFYFLLRFTLVTGFVFGLLMYLKHIR